jgi:hypothetical protein
LRDGLKSAVRPEGEAGRQRKVGVDVGPRRFYDGLVIELAEAPPPASSDESR